MKTTVYYLWAILTALCLVSCDEKDETPSALTGTWDYTRPHFELEYASDSISLEMYQGKKLAIAVEELKEMFLNLATEKMGDYFQGMEVVSADELHILAKRQNSAPLTIGAAYQQTDEFIQVTLNPADMQQLMGEKAEMIPAISFRYSLRDETLTMYFDAAYIRTIYAMMENRIVPAIVDMMGIDFSRMPEGVREKVTDGVKQQIPLLLDKIIRLEIGFVLTRVS